MTQETSPLIGCPVCVHRAGLVIDENCPICRGHGVLVTHPAALSVASPPAIASAVQAVVEAHARTVEESMTLSEDRQHAMETALDQLVAGRILQPQRPYVGWQSGVLLRRPDGELIEVDMNYQADGTIVIWNPKDSQPDNDPDQPDTPEPPRPLHTFTAHTTPRDQQLPQAPAYQYRPDDRPGARGLNVLSATGHPSATARVCDPPDLLNSTRTILNQQAADARTARILTDALPTVIRRRTRHTH